MPRYIGLLTVSVLMLTSIVWADPTVTLTLEAIKDGQTIGQGMPIQWTIKVAVSTGDNAGLALIGVDLAQDDANPAFFDIPPATGVPPEMTNLSRPAGISNPGESDPNTGYIGVQRGDSGHKDLIQIGGGQNTFGEALDPGTGIGENANVTGGIGQSGAQTVASGTFDAPDTPGVYTFTLENAVANVVETLNTPPDYSPVVSATVQFSPASINFTVGNYAIGDLNCDGSVNSLDIDAFVLALTAPTDYNTQYPSCELMLADCNGDSTVNSLDIDPFVSVLTGS